MSTFDSYIEPFLAKRQVAEGQAHEAGLKFIERLALKLGWLVETGKAPIPAGRKGSILAVLVAKLSNELLAFGGALRMGALLGAWQH